MDRQPSNNACTLLLGHTNTHLHEMNMYVHAPTFRKMILLSAQHRILSSNTLVNMKILSQNAIRTLSNTTVNYSELTQPQEEMSEQEMALYKLYRPERVTPMKRGVDLLKDSRINKGMAFSLFERQYLGIHGLLPPAFMTEDQQAYRVISQLRQQPNDLARYIQLNSLQ
ncbi:unnamed protein product, partial [Onchocerca ochengi]|uniref:Malic enzyme N-terminal domain-containing protein n=1 Tax=Onchocerca ochengi TaxID=42157 RepID=A0A182EW70_ONCOC